MVALTMLADGEAAIPLPHSHQRSNRAFGDYDALAATAETDR